MNLKLGLNPGISNELYHKDINFYSSSDYKTLLKSPYEFYENKILKIAREEKEKDHFAVGSLTHSLILEPHLVSQEYAIYPGLVRRGKEYEEFKAAHPGKTIVTASQNSKALAHQRAYKNTPFAINLLEGTKSEYTIVQDYNDIPTKVRCDAIHVDKGYIVDIKTSSFPIDPFSFKETVKRWDYELSAALYCEIAAQYYGKPFEFFWHVIASSDSENQVYKMSQRTREAGLARVYKAAAIYRQCLASGNWPKVLGIEEKLQQSEIIEI